MASSASVHGVYAAAQTGDEGVCLGARPSRSRLALPSRATGSTALPKVTLPLLATIGPARLGMWIEGACLRYRRA